MKIGEPLQRWFYRWHRRRWVAYLNSYAPWQLAAELYVPLHIRLYTETTFALKRARLAN